LTTSIFNHSSQKEPETPLTNQTQDTDRLIRIEEEIRQSRIQNKRISQEQIQREHQKI